MDMAFVMVLLKYSSVEPFPWCLHLTYLRLEAEELPEVVMARSMFSSMSTSLLERRAGRVWLYNTQIIATLNTMPQLTFW